MIGGSIFSGNGGSIFDGNQQPKLGSRTLRERSLRLRSVSGGFFHPTFTFFTLFTLPFRLLVARGQ